MIVQQIQLSFLELIKSLEDKKKISPQGNMPEGNAAIYQNVGLGSAGLLWWGGA